MAVVMVAVAVAAAATAVMAESVMCVGCFCFVLILILNYFFLGGGGVELTPLTDVAADREEMVSSTEVTSVAHNPLQLGVLTATSGRQPAG